MSGHRNEEDEMETKHALEGLAAAALVYVAADRNYRVTYASSGQKYGEPLNAETEAACKESNRTLHALERAAWNLALARGHIQTEQMRGAFYDEIEKTPARSHAEELADALKAAEEFVNCTNGCEARRDGGACTCGGEAVHEQMLAALRLAGRLP